MVSLDQEFRQCLHECGPSHFSHMTLCDPMDYSPPGSSVHGVLQARTLEWVAISFSRGSSLPRDQAWVSCIAGRFLTTEPPGKPFRQCLAGDSYLGTWLQSRLSTLRSHLLCDLGPLPRSLIFWQTLDFIEERNSNPLQYSCLKNSMNKGAWQATVLEVEKSWIQLSN